VPDTEPGTCNLEPETHNSEPVSHPVNARQRHKRFRELIAAAAKDESLQTALQRFTKAYAKARSEAFEGIDFEAATRAAREVKERAIGKLPELMARFQKEAEAVQAVVYLAETPEQANDYILDLAKKNGVELVAKGKSMLTEEIRLREHLEAEDITVVETDLGEWIVQLAGERPSHFTVPAIHKTREQVAELFKEAVGHDVPSDIPSLVKVARAELRNVFLNAGMGITGANIGIAETGTVVIVTNEGNGRLVATLPPIHVVVMGIEKIVETMEDAVAILKVLSKSGTGQKATSYVSFITGPSRTSDIEKTLTVGVHGPAELHIVLVDNKRSAIRDDPDFLETLYCIKCGACLNVCPPFGSVGGHVFGGEVYAGGIGSAITAANAGPREAAESAGLCSGCLTCADFCPVGIDVPGMLDEIRTKLSETESPSLGRRAGAAILKRPKTMQRTASALSKAQRPFVDEEGMIEKIPFMGFLTRFKELPALAPKPLRDLAPKMGFSRKQVKTPTVALYPGCVVDYIYPRIGMSILKSLTKLGIRAFLPEQLTCCGVPMKHLGDLETARLLAKMNLAALAGVAWSRRLDPAGITPHLPETIVTACPTCAGALSRDFEELLEGDWRRVAAELAKRTIDFSKFLVDVVGLTRLSGSLLRAPRSGLRALDSSLQSPVSSLESAVGSRQSAVAEVTYHDPCHALHGIKVSEEPRQVIRALGYELVEMAEHDRCCGFAGDYSVRYPEISEVILKRKLDNIEASGATIVATDCPGCIMQIAGGLRARKSTIRVAHTAELVAEALDCRKGEQR
jgi:L-lactate dehydrogenase complex protein LldF